MCARSSDQESSVNNNPAVVGGRATVSKKLGFKGFPIQAAGIHPSWIGAIDNRPNKAQPSCPRAQEVREDWVPWSATEISQTGPMDNSLPVRQLCKADRWNERCAGRYMLIEDMFGTYER